jgi:hypothetical protein
MAAIQIAFAQPVRSCPEGQAVQSLQPNGTPVQCVAVPAPVDIAPIMQAIVQESAERKQADAELRASIGESSIVGRYFFTGTQNCVSAPLGFNADFTAIGTASVASASVWGHRTFNADNTGTIEFDTLGVNLGGANTFHLVGAFRWRLEADKLVIEETQPAVGIIPTGPRAGWTTFTENVPPTFAILGKDRRTISMVHAAPAVEISVARSPEGTQEIRTPRICHRERMLSKISEPR